MVLLLTAAHASAAGLTSFCRFAIISLVIDLVAFFTFFIAALALSLRPRGLPDSVDDSTQSNSLRKGLRETIYQRGRRMQGNDVPTKRTGVGAPSLIVDLLIVIGLTCFAGLHFLDASTLAVQHHVTMPQGYPTILHRYLSAILGHDSRNYHRGGPDTVSWFRGQSPVTLGEFVQVVKPQSSSFFAKVYAPLLVVSDVAARNASLAAADSSSHHQAKLPPPLLLGGVLVSLLLLLPASIKGANGRRSVGGDGSAGGNGGSGGGISLARCLARLHELDIFILTSCSRRFLVSVGFDRQLRLWNLEAAVPEEEPSTLIVAPPKGHGTDSGSDAAKDSVSWPVSLAAVDDHTDWVAFCSRNGHVTLWNRRTRVFGRTVVLEPGEHVAACFVVAVPAAPHPALHGSRRGSDGETTPTSTASATMATTSTRLLIVLRSGRLLDIDVHRPGATIKHKICEGAVRSPHVTWTSMGGGISGGGPRHGPTLKLATVTQDESVFESTRRDGRWTTRPIRIAAVGLGLGQFRAGTPVGTTATPVPLYQQPQARPRVRVSVVESLRGIALIYDEERGVLHLVDMVSDAIIYTFRHRPAAGPRGIRLGSLRALHPPPRQCVSCGSSAVASFSVAYTENLGGDDAATARDGDGTNKNRAGSVFTMTSVSVAPSAPRPVLCLRAERDSRERRCLGLAGGVEVTHRLENPGVWEATGANGVAGVRRLRHGTPANSPEQQHGLRPGVFPRGSTAMPSSSWTSATTALSAGIGIGRRRRTAAATVAATTTSVAGHKADGGPAGGPTDRWQAWTMTAAGVVGTHELPAARLGLPADTAGPACRLARNAVAVAIANVIVLVQLGQQLRDDDPEGAAGAGGELAPGGTRTRSGRHSRQTSRFGRETVALPT